MGLATVAVYSDCDRDALHVRLADEAYAIGPDQRIGELSPDRQADRRGAPIRARTPCIRATDFSPRTRRLPTPAREAGLTFIGPDPRRCARWAARRRARAIALAAGVPVVPEEMRPGRRSGYPLLVKAVAGGGGKGMRVVRAADELAGAVQTGAIGSAVVVRRRSRVFRAAAREAASHRGAAAWRQARHDRAVRRARVFDSATASEADRGNALAVRHAASCADG